MVPAKARDRWFRHFSLPKAASIALLLTGAAVTALPGSPVRRWLGNTLRGNTVVETGAAESPTTEGIPAPLASGSANETGITLPSGEEGVELWIEGLAPEAELRILWIQDGQAGIFATEGTRFERRDNRLEAFTSTGSVRVELPLDVGRALVGVNGEIVLRVTEEGVEVLGPVRTRTGTEILFGPWNPPGRGRP